jgi:hypothetical protein
VGEASPTGLALLYGGFMKSVDEKVNDFLIANIGTWNTKQERALKRLLLDQDRDTRHACAEAVLQMDEPLDSSAAPSIAHNICMNTKAV